MTKWICVLVSALYMTSNVEITIRYLVFPLFFIPPTDSSELNLVLKLNFLLRVPLQLSFPSQYQTNRTFLPSHTKFTFLSPSCLMQFHPVSRLEIPSAWSNPPFDQVMQLTSKSVTCFDTLNICSFNVRHFALLLTSLIFFFNYYNHHTTTAIRHS